MNVLNIIGNSLVRAKKSMAIYGMDEGNPIYFVGIAFAGRLICGIATGISSFIVPLYSNSYAVREMAPCDIYAKLGAVNQSMITFGIFLAYLSFLVIYSEKFIFAIFGFPILVSCIQMSLFLWIYTSETPTFLMIKDKKKEAMMLMSTLYYNNPSVADSDGMFGSLAVGSEFEVVSYTDLFKTENLFNFKLGCIVSVLQQLTGINVVIYSSSNYLISINEVKIYYAVCMIGFVNFVSGSISVFLLKDRYKSFLQIGALGMTLCYMGILFITYIVSAENFAYFYLTLLFLFIVCFEFSIGPIMWIYCADVLSDKGISLTSAINWAGALVMGGIFSNVQIIEFFQYKNSDHVPFFFLNLFFGSACFVVIGT